MDAASTSQGLGSTMAEPVYIVSAARTAIGDFGGALKEFAPAELATRVIQEAVKRAGLQPGDVQHVVLGQVIPSEPPAANGRASCRERVCQYVSISGVAVSLKKKEKHEEKK